MAEAVQEKLMADNGKTTNRKKTRRKAGSTNTSDTARKSADSPRQTGGVASAPPPKLSHDTFTAQPEAHRTIDPSRYRSKGLNGITATPYGWRNGAGTPPESEITTCS